MNLFFKTTTFVFILLLYSLSIGQQKKLTVSGKVIDSITGNPVPDVWIILTANVSAVMKGDLNAISNDSQSTRSDNSGKFSTELSVDLTSFMLAGIFIKGKYQIKVKTLTLLFNRANFGTVKIRKEEFRDIEVTGIVKDSLTGRPVKEAPVILTNSTIMYDSVYHLLTTNDQGRFSSEMKIGKGGIIHPWIFYLVQKEGYDTLMNMVPDDGKSKIDLGMIRIYNRSTPIKKISLTKSDLLTPNPSSVSIYSLNGQLLYSGHEVNMILPGNNYILSSRPVVVRYKYPHLLSRGRLFHSIK